MSKKQEQPDGAPIMPETPDMEFQTETSENVSLLDMTYLIGSILDYYSDETEIDGEDWKKKSGLSKRMIPSSIEKEVEKAFICQLRKFQD